MIDALLTSAFTLWGMPVSWAELLAMVLSLWMIERNLRVNVWGWPLAIAASLLYALVFWQAKLYGEAVLQGVFVALSAWGWQQWRQDRGPTPHRRALSLHNALLTLIATVFSWALIMWLLQSYSDSTTPVADAGLTAASLAGQWLLARKHLQTWPVWLGVNVGSVALFASKSMPLTALLYAVFAVLSVVGWLAWRRLPTA